MSRVHVTDHAVLRYLERHYGLDVDRVRREIEAMVAPHASAQPEKVIAGSLVFCLGRDGAVTTTLLRRKEVYRRDRTRTGRPGHINGQDDGQLD